MHFFTYWGTMDCSGVVCAFFTYVPGLLRCALCIFYLLGNHRLLGCGLCIFYLRELWTDCSTDCSTVCSGVVCAFFTYWGTTDSTARVWVVHFLLTGNYGLTAQVWFVHFLLTGNYRLLMCGLCRYALVWHIVMANFELLGSTITANNKRSVCS